MSLRLLTAVWDHAPVSQSTLLVLLALADRANDAGTCWPSVAEMAQRARVSERQVQRALGELERAAWLQREARPGRMTLYRITPHVTPDTGVTPDTQVTPDVEVADPRHGSHPTPDTQVANPRHPGHPNHQEPPSEPSENRQSARERAPATRGTRVPDPFEITPEMAEWARQHVPSLDYQAVTEKFVDYWRAVPGAKGVKLDWTATWRNWLRTDSERHQTRRSPRTTAGTSPAERLAAKYPDSPFGTGPTTIERTA
jgi:hypothetical protein